MGCGRDDGIGQVVASMGREACLIERRKIAFVDESEVNIFSQRIEVGDFSKPLIVRWASVFGKVVALEEQRDLIFCECFDEIGKEDVFGQRRIVNDPEVRLR